jgi:hypothetical protein
MPVFLHRQYNHDDIQISCLCGLWMKSRIQIAKFHRTPLLFGHNCDVNAGVLPCGLAYQVQYKLAWQGR